MKHSPNRRSFLKKSVAAALTVPVVTSLEEYALASQTASVSTPPSASGSKGTLPTGTIGKVKISRLICGGNLISGYAHSRDLIYVSPLLNHYFTDEKIMETWALCEQHGINTMIAFGGDPHAVEVYRKYRAQGGRIQYLAQIAPKTTDLKTAVKEAVDSGAVGAFLVAISATPGRAKGGGTDGEGVQVIKAAGLISAVAGHELRPTGVWKKAGIAPAFTSRLCTTTTIGRSAVRTRCRRGLITTAATTTGVWTRRKR